MTGPQEPVQVGSLLVFHYFSNVSFVPGTVLDNVYYLIRPLTATPKMSIIIINLANEETKPRK